MAFFFVCTVVGLDSAARGGGVYWEREGVATQGRGVW